MPSPPQGFTVILPGEITQSDLDPQQPPARLSSYPLTIGRDMPGPNESNYVANDNTGNLLDIVNSDSSSTTLSALKMAIDALTIIRTNGKLAINLANENTWSAAQSFSAGLATNTLNLNGTGPISALVSSFNGRTGAVAPASGDYSHQAMISLTTATVYEANSVTKIGTIETGPNGVVFWNGSCLTESPSSSGFEIYVGFRGFSVNSNIGPTSTTGSNWSVNNDTSAEYYPVIITGMTSGSIHSPNTSYPIYLGNFTSSPITVVDFTLSVIGL
jgi:hypothetical protein